MICEDPTVCASLRRLVCRLCRGGVLDEDLMQEGLFCLWQLEKRKPGQTLSWYLQGCRFHMLNQLAAGRSLDARKREGGRLSLYSSQDQEAFLGQWETETAVMPESGVDEVLSLLSQGLTAGERVVLDYLAAGFGVREIARRTGVSHQAIVKRRQRIAAAARQLGIIPASPEPYCCGPEKSSAGPSLPTPERPPNGESRVAIQPGKTVV